jgi:hypothetical protein
MEFERVSEQDSCSLLSNCVDFLLHTDANNSNNNNNVNRGKIRQSTLVLPCTKISRKK